MTRTKRKRTKRIKVKVSQVSGTGGRRKERRGRGCSLYVQKPKSTTTGHLLRLRIKTSELVKLPPVPCKSRQQRSQVIVKSPKEGKFELREEGN